jgi:putative membrane protein
MLKLREPAGERICIGFPFGTSIAAASGRAPRTLSTPSETTTMRKPLSLTVLSLCTALACAGLAQAQNPATSSREAPPASAAATPAASDSEALSTLTAVNEHEIKAAEIARGKQISKPTLDYANMLHKDHSANLAKVRELSQASKTPISESAEVKALKDKTSAERDKLSQLDGPAFETAYLDAMIQGHAGVLSTIDGKLLPAATDSGVTTHLRNTRESVKKHHDQAQNLRSALKGP